MAALHPIHCNDKIGLFKDLDQSIKDQPFIGPRPRFEIFLKDFLGGAYGPQSDVFIRHSQISKINSD